jgi:radical SAM protein with 4Fe4S-binding SPASM domain
LKSKKTHVQLQTQNNYIPRNLLFQWHITERCNLRCTHCYQDSYKGKELTFDELVSIHDQYLNLITDWRSKKKIVFGHITVTGGEPFIRKDFIELLDIFKLNKQHYSVGILTNGHFITKEVALNLKQLNLRYIQVSIEGTKETNDKIRGRGSYDKTINAIQILKKEKIRTLVSFTVHKFNYQEFPAVVRLARRLKVDRVWSDRLIPSGSGENLNLMTPEETQNYFKLMKKQRSKFNINLPFSIPFTPINKTEVAMHRALQFLECGSQPYQCTAGDRLITIQPNGDLLPCRRMPIVVGNIMKTSLKTLYYQSKLFQKLRNKNVVSKGCENCEYVKKCRGGLKCLSYAVHNDPFIVDPGCWLINRKY